MGLHFYAWPILLTNQLFNMYTLKSKLGYWLYSDDYTLDKSKATHFDTIKCALYWKNLYNLNEYQPV